MSGLGEQIAVLDGLGALDPNDGRIGQVRPRVDQYGRLIMRDVLAKQNMIQASGGANYSGGSSYFPRGPLMPSSVGLADVPSMLPARRNVVDPSYGVNYMGGASWTPGMPLLPSSAGLASTLIEGGYGRAGLGSPLIDGGYGRAGLGGTGTYVDEDLAAAAEIVEVARKLDPADGRTGQYRAQVDEYGRPVMPGVLARSNVIDPSEGANYGGGSTYYAGGPLTPSNSGLAGLAGCGCPAGMAGFGATKPALSAAERTKLQAQLSQHRKLAEIERKRMAIAAQGRSTASRIAYTQASMRYKMHLAAINVLQARLLGRAPAPAAIRVLAAGKPKVGTPAGTQMWR